MSTGAPQLRPLSVGETIDVAFKVYKGNWATLAKIVAIVVVPLSIISLLVRLSSLPSGTTVDSGRIVYPGTQAPSLLGANLVVAFLSILGTALATGALFKAVSDA